MGWRGHVKLLLWRKREPTWNAETVLVDGYKRTQTGRTWTIRGRSLNYTDREVVMVWRTNDDEMSFRIWSYHTKEVGIRISFDKIYWDEGNGKVYFKS